jgi:WD40 repeat protein
MTALASTRFVRRWEHELHEPLRTVVPSPDGTRLAAAAVEGPIRIIDAADGATLQRLRGHEFGTKSVDWSPDSAHLLSCGQDGYARVWRCADGAERGAVDLGSRWGERVAVSPRGDSFATAAGRHVRLWSFDGALLCDWPERTSTVLDIAWRPGSKRSRLAAVSYAAVGLYDPGKRDRAAKELRWKGSSLVLAWSPDGEYLATGDQDASVHFWLVKSGRDLMMAGYPRKVRELSWSRTGRWLATGGGFQIIVWDCSKSPEGSEPIVLEHHETPLSALAFQRRGNLLASASLDGVLAVWQPSVHREPIGGMPGDDEVAALTWTARDELVVGRLGGEVALWDAIPG